MIAWLVESRLDGFKSTQVRLVTSSVGNCGPGAGLLLSSLRPPPSADGVVQRRPDLVHARLPPAVFTSHFVGNSTKFLCLCNRCAAPASAQVSGPPATLAAWPQMQGRPPAALRGALPSGSA